MQPQKTIVLIGGSGFIGTKLTETLLTRGYSVTIADIVPPRAIPDGVTYVHANPTQEPIPKGLFDGVYGIVNLAGASIGKRWSKEYKKLLYTSRINTTRAIVTAIDKTTARPVVLVSASACGYYGDKGEQLVYETATPGTDYLSCICIDWEKEATKAEAFGVRVAQVRTANVLGPGGILATLTPLFKNGLGGYFGNSRQYMPWVHYKDIVGIYMFLLEHDARGPFNTGAGKTPSQKELFKAFGKAVHAPLVWRIPGFMARVALGEFGNALLGSQNTDSSAIVKAGYSYEFDSMESAFDDLYPHA